MKKFLVTMNFLFIMMITLNICLAGVKDHYDNDPDYILMWAHHGSYHYLYLPSIDVQEYNPPHYQIGYDYIAVNEHNDKEFWINDVKRFNWYTKESFHLENGNWVVDNVSGNLGSAIRARYAANIIFRAAYNMDFYGNCAEQNNFVEATDYYVGDHSDGAKAYLMTNTILRHYVTATDGTGYVEFTFKVKAVYSNDSRIDNYYFDGTGGIFSVNGKRRSGNWTTVEKNIYEYIKKIKWNR